MRKSVNHTYFSTINSEEKTYWLGYLAADGTVRDTNEVSLSSIDSEQIEKFKISIKSDHKICRIITPHKPIYRIYFRSKQICSDLAKYNIVPRKTYKNFGLPDFSDDLIKDYIRGYFDGDGCITSDDNKNTKRWYIGCCSNSYRILDEITSYFYRKLSIPKPLVKHRTNKWGSSFIFRYGGNTSVCKICSHLYENSTVYLDRKYKLAFDIINQRNQKIDNQITKFIGVQKDRNRFKTKIKINGKYLFLGSYINEIDAAKAYDITAIKHNRRNINFPISNCT